MTPSNANDGRRENAPCPKCESDRVNRIGHARTMNREFSQSTGPSATDSPPQPMDYVYICERCAHSWKPVDKK